VPARYYWPDRATATGHTSKTTTSRSRTPEAAHRASEFQEEEEEEAAGEAVPGDVAGDRDACSMGATSHTPVS
jgi:hypothetical protein